MFHIIFANDLLPIYRNAMIQVDAFICVMKTVSNREFPYFNDEFHKVFETLINFCFIRRIKHSFPYISLPKLNKLPLIKNALFIQI